MERIPFEMSKEEADRDFYEIFGYSTAPKTELRSERWLCVDCGEWVDPSESGPPYDEDSGGNPTCVCLSCRG